MRSGDFATARRGSLSRDELLGIWKERQKARPTPWQVLAKMYGYPESYIRELMLSDEDAQEMLSGNEAGPAIDDAPKPDRHYRTLEPQERQERLEAFKRLWADNVPHIEICRALDVDGEWIRKTRIRHKMPARENVAPARPARAMNIVWKKKT